MDLRRTADTYVGGTMASQCAGPGAAGQAIESAIHAVGTICNIDSAPSEVAFCPFYTGCLVALQREDFPPGRRATGTPCNAVSGWRARCARWHPGIELGPGRRQGAR